MDVELLSAMNNDLPKQNNEDRIFSILFQEDELTWQTIIMELVKNEEMDPWDISIATIAEKFVVMLKKMQEMDFRIGGKMILAAAYLVRMKTDRLMKEDMVALDNIINSPEDLDLLEDLDELSSLRNVDKPSLIPRTPQPRQRKVSVYDLVEALEKALDVETRKQFRTQSNQAPEVKIPDKPQDMTVIINNVYNSIKKKFSFSKIITFDQLIPSTAKEDMVYTFIPLLHLDTQRKIDLMQKEHFGTINIKVNKHKLLEKEA